MIDNQNVIDYINYGFVKTTKKHLVEGLLLVWICGLPTIIFSNYKILFTLINIPFLLLPTIFFISKYNKYKEMKYRYLFDCWCTFSLTVYLLVNAYNIVSYERQYSVIFLILSFFSLFVFVSILLFIVRITIRKGKYCKGAQPVGASVYIFALLGGVLGTATLRLIAPHIDAEELGFTPVAYGLIFFALLISLGICFNWLKVYYMKKLDYEW